MESVPLADSEADEVTELGAVSLEDGAKEALTELEVVSLVDAVEVNELEAV